MSMQKEVQNPIELHFLHQGKVDSKKLIGKTEMQSDMAV